MNAIVKSPTASLDELSEQYTAAADGFYGTYAGIGAVLGLTTPGPVPTAGAAADAGGLSALDPILALAGDSRSPTSSDLAAVSDLCFCQVAEAADGVMLRRAYFRSEFDPETAAIHRASAAVLTKALDEKTGNDVTMLMERLCCYAPAMVEGLGDAQLAGHALRWRGALLRNWVVWAWRMLWAELVETLVEPGTPEQAADVFAAGLPVITVRQALDDDLPATRGAGDLPLPAEHDLAAEAESGGWPVLRLLRLLAVAARRVTELDDPARAAFLRYDAELGPGWIRDWIEKHADQPLPDAARSLALALFRRADQVSLGKLQWTPEGLRMPTRLRMVGDLLQLIGEESRSRMSLRLETFSTMLLQLGVLRQAPNGVWQPGPYSGEVLC